MLTARVSTVKMMPRQAYAPTPHSYVPNTALSATINLDEVSHYPAVTLGWDVLSRTTLCRK